MSYHINDAGEVKPCNAQPGNCPVGGAHHGDEKSARAAYENSQKANTIPAPKKSLSELNNLVKDTTDVELLTQALLHGSERTFANLAKNTNDDPAVRIALMSAAASTKDEKTKIALQDNPNFPANALSPEDFAAKLNRLDRYGKQREEMLKSNFVGDDHVRAILNSGDGVVGHQALSNSDNKVSPEMLTEVVSVKSANGNSYKHSFVAVLRNKNFNLSQAASQIDPERVNHDISYSDDPAGLTSLTDHVIERSNENDKNYNRPLSHIAANESTPREALIMIANHIDEVKYEEDNSALLSVYKNKNADSEVKHAAMSKSPMVESYDHISKLDKDGALGRAIGSGAEERLQGSSSARVVTFNKDKVKELGLSSGDIDTYVRYYRGNYLFGGSYNESTGIYKGFID